MANPLYGSENFSTTLNVGGGINSSQTTGIILTSVSGLATTGGVIGIDWASAIDTSTYEEIEYGGITGNELTGVVRGSAGTSGKAHSNGAVIVAVISKLHNDRLADKLTSRDATAIQDPNGNEILKSAYNASAVNEVTVTNQATGTGPSISATGTDSNIDLNLVPKGTGSVKINGQAIAGGADGWVASSDTWVYVSASSFKITGVDRTTTFTKGTRLKFTNSTVKYAVVTSSTFGTDTTVNIAVNTDYTLSNTTISSPYYSYAVNPQGYPDWFNFTPANITWDSVAPTTLATTMARFRIEGKMITLQVTLLYTNAGTTNALLNFDGPVAAAQATAAKYFYPVSGFISDNASGPVTFPCIASIYSTTPTFYIQRSSGNVNAKYGSCFAQYEI